nr:uncharacterized protein LOC113806942 [Penaeus vannamei]
MEPKSASLSKEAELDWLKTVAELAEEKNAILTQELQQLGNTLVEEEKELKKMERRYEEESANDKAMESLLSQLPKNNLLERGKKLQKIASKVLPPPSYHSASPT